MRQQRRYPFVEVVDEVVRRLGDDAYYSREFESQPSRWNLPSVDRNRLDAPNAHRCAAELGIDVRDWHRFIAKGDVAWFVADRLACRLGLHPSLLWPSWFDDSLVDTADEMKLRRREYDRTAKLRKRKQRARDRYRAWVAACDGAPA